MNKDSDPEVRAESKRVRDKKQGDIEKVRRKMLESSKKDSYVLLPPGQKDFDPALGQTQLREAAEEFRDDYQVNPRARTGNWLYSSTEMLSNLVYIFSDDDAAREYKKIKKSASDRFDLLFPAQGEGSNAQQAGGLVRALFDDQVHDSRAWFLQATFSAREPWGSYFLYRMIYFGERLSKNITPLVKFGRYFYGGFKDVVSDGGLYIERFEKYIGNNGEDSIPKIKQKISVINNPTDIPVAMASDFPSQPALTNEPAEIIAHRQKSLEAEKLAHTKSTIASLWS